MKKSNSKLVPYELPVENKVIETALNLKETNLALKEATLEKNGEDLAIKLSFFNMDNPVYVSITDFIENTQDYPDLHVIVDNYIKTYL